MQSEFIKYRPSPNLSEYVQYFWSIQEVSSTTTNHTELFVPGGCVQMGFEFGDEANFYTDPENIKLRPRSYIEGTFERAFYVNYKRSINSFGVLFYPGKFHALSNVCFSETSDKIIPVSEIFGFEGKNLTDSLLNANSNDDRVSILSEFLSRSILRNKLSRETKEVLHLMDGISSPTRKPKLYGSITQSGYSDRHTRRLFSKFTGMSPKRFDKVIRLERTLTDILENPIDSLTSTCLNHGYFDQSHFNRDFKSIIGISPSKYLSSAVSIDTHYFKKTD